MTNEIIEINKRIRILRKNLLFADLKKLNFELIRYLQCL